MLLPKSLSQNTDVATNVRWAALFFASGMILPALLCFDLRSRLLSLGQEIEAVEIGVLGLVFVALPLYAIKFLKDGPGSSE